MSTGGAIGAVGMGLEGSMPAGAPVGGLPASPNRIPSEIPLQSPLGSRIGNPLGTSASARTQQASFAEQFVALGFAGAGVAKRRSAPTETPAQLAMRKETAEAQARGPLHPGKQPVLESVDVSPATGMKPPAPIARGSGTGGMADPGPQAVPAAKTATPPPTEGKALSRLEGAGAGVAAKRWDRAGRSHDTKQVADGSGTAPAREGGGPVRMVSAVPMGAPREAPLAAVQSSVFGAAPISTVEKASAAQSGGSASGSVSGDVSIKPGARSRQDRTAGGAGLVAVAAGGAAGGSAGLEAAGAGRGSVHAAAGALAAGLGEPPAASAQGVAAGGGIGAMRVAPEAGFVAGAFSATLLQAGGASEAGHGASVRPGYVPHDEVEGAGGIHPVAGGAGFGGEGSAHAEMGAARMLVATPNVLEVGITGGAHGWLRVRAELEHTGEVTASLMASSAASAATLHRELSAMSAYLKSEAVGVSSLAVAGVEKSAAMQGLGSGASGAGTGAGTQGSGGGGRAGREGGEREAGSSAWAGFRDTASGFGAGYGIHAVPPALLASGVGGWLNVRV